MSKDDDDFDNRVGYVDEFLHSLFAVVGACLEEGDDAEVSVNGIRIITFKVGRQGEEENNILPEEQIEEYDTTNVFDLSKWKPTGEKN